MALVKVFMDRVESSPGDRPLWIIKSPDACDIQVEGHSREEALSLFKELCSRAIPDQSINYAMVIRKQPPTSHLSDPPGFRAVM